MELAFPHLPRMKSRSQGWLYCRSRYFPLGWMFFGVLYRLPRIFRVPPPTVLECSLCWVPASQTLAFHSEHPVSSYGGGFVLPVASGAKFFCCGFMQGLPSIVTHICTLGNTFHLFPNPLEVEPLPTQLPALAYHPCSHQPYDFSKLGPTMTSCLTDAKEHGTGSF